MYPPTVILARTGRDPAAVGRRIGLIDLDRVALRPAPWILRRLWIGSVTAMTVGRCIYVDPRILFSGDTRRLADLVIHELVHVEQWRRLRPVGFLRRYLSEYLAARCRGMSHQDAYRRISLEREASEIAATL